MTQLYTGLTGLILTSLLLPFAWQSLDSWHIWLLLVLQGVASSVGHYLLTVAFRHAPVSVLAPFLYLQIAFGTLGAWLIFGHVPNTLAAIGITTVFLCGVFSAGIMASERRKLASAPQLTV